MKNNMKNMVGKGNFAGVYRVWDESRNCMVAWKISGETRILRREAEVMEELEHPLFPRFFDYWEQNGQGVLCMEYVWGQTLEELLARRGRMSIAASVGVTKALAEGLMVLHERRESWIYRDLKPANVLIDERGRVRLVDLGCVAPAGERIRAGSRGFAAPEQFADVNKVGPHSDVYGLGRIMLAMNDFSNDPDVREVAQHCLRTDIKERIPDMRALLGELGKNKNLFLPKKEKYLYEKNIIYFY